MLGDGDRVAVILMMSASWSQEEWELRLGFRRALLGLEFSRFLLSAQLGIQFGIQMALITYSGFRTAEMEVEINPRISTFFEVCNACVEQIYLH